MNEEQPPNSNTSTGSESLPERLAGTLALPTSNTPPGWEPLPLEHLPQPTFFPAGLAMGTTFIFWGFITSWVILVMGLGLFAAALAGWITDIRHERTNH